MPHQASPRPSTSTSNPSAPRPAEPLLAVVPAADARYVRIDRIGSATGDITEHLTTDGVRTLCGLRIVDRQDASGNFSCRRCQKIGRSRVVADMSNDSSSPMQTWTSPTPAPDPDHTATVMILIGAPGSGKSHFANDTWIRHEGRVTIVSADAYFTDAATGKYHFNPARLADAHAECLRLFTKALVNVATFGRHADADKRLIIVDNTNTTALEIAPYYAVARAFRARILLVNFAAFAHADECVARNTHGVPEAVVRAAHARTCKIFPELPPYWECEKLMAENDRVALDVTDNEG